MINSIDEKITFSKRHPNETIRQIIRYDSGYLKDLFQKDERVVFSDNCMAELCRLTQGHKDNWENPSIQTANIFNSIKTFAVPYLFDFNDDNILNLNKERQRRL